LKEIHISTDTQISYRNTRNMKKKECNMAPSKASNSSISKLKDTEIVELSDENFNFKSV
jgi:hypothetical protein